MATNGYCTRCKTYCYGDCYAADGARGHQRRQVARPAVNAQQSAEKKITINGVPMTRAKVEARLAEAQVRLAGITDAYAAGIVRAEIERLQTALA